jgi:hypothetical protein
MIFIVSSSSYLPLSLRNLTTPSFIQYLLPILLNLKQQQKISLAKYCNISTFSFTILEATLKTALRQIICKKGHFDSVVTDRKGQVFVRAAKNATSKQTSKLVLNNADI